MARKVMISTRTVGQSFATAGVIRDLGTGRKLAEGPIAPLGFVAAAVERARGLAESRGWTVVDEVGDECA